ncbi:MAG: hypothetical protein V3V31_00690 [Methylococcales bacterium]
MIGKSGQNGLFRSRFSILGRSPKRRTVGRVISFKILQEALREKMHAENGYSWAREVYIFQ